MKTIKYNRIKAVLTDKNVKAKELAEHLGYTVGHVSKWNRNIVQPPVETLFEIADYLRVDVRELLVVNKNAPGKKE